MKAFCFVLSAVDWGHAVWSRNVITSRAYNVMTRKTEALAFCCKRNECSSCSGFYLRWIKQDDVKNDVLWSSVLWWLNHNMFDRPFMQRLHTIKSIITNSDAVIHLSAAAVHSLKPSSRRAFLLRSHAEMSTRPSHVIKTTLTLTRFPQINTDAPPSRLWQSSLSCMSGIIYSGWTPVTLLFLNMA